MPFKIRLISLWHTDLKVADFHYSTSYSLEEADALLSEWAPSEELLRFSRPKAWYCCEATSNSAFRQPGWKFFRETLPPAEFLYHAHPDLRYRVPHVTHFSYDYPMADRADRLSKAIAVVSNTGGPPWRRKRDMDLRLKFITHSQVDLYGRSQAWRTYRANFLSRAGCPRNYCGEVAGSWSGQARFELMSHYKAAICFENTSEPFYFTEKFVGAVQTGCIPIYHAHETVRQGVLSGALWVDPADFEYDADATIEFALKEDWEKYRSVNDEWLKSEGVQTTHVLRVFERIGQILQWRQA